MSDDKIKVYRTDTGKTEEIDVIPNKVKEKIDQDDLRDTSRTSRKRELAALKAKRKQQSESSTVYAIIATRSYYEDTEVVIMGMVSSIEEAEKWVKENRSLQRLYFNDTFLDIQEFELGVIQRANWVTLERCIKDALNHKNSDVVDMMALLIERGQASIGMVREEEKKKGYHHGQYVKAMGHLVSMGLARKEDQYGWHFRKKDIIK